MITPPTAQQHSITRGNASSHTSHSVVSETVRECQGVVSLPLTSTKCEREVGLTGSDGRLRHGGSGRETTARMEREREDRHCTERGRKRSERDANNQEENRQG
jgi:hypothetical protein